MIEDVARLDSEMNNNYGNCRMQTMHVECYSGYRGEETPRRFWMGERCIGVRRVIDLWLSPDHRYFKLLGDDGGIYILRHDAHQDRWELTFFQQTPVPD